MAWYVSVALRLRRSCDLRKMRPVLIANWRRRGQDALPPRGRRFRALPDELLHDRRHTFYVPFRAFTSI